MNTTALPLNSLIFSSSWCSLLLNFFFEVFSSVIVLFSSMISVYSFFTFFWIFVEALTLFMHTYCSSYFVYAYLCWPQPASLWPLFLTLSFKSLFFFFTSLQDLFLEIYLVLLFGTYSFVSSFSWILWFGFWTLPKTANSTSLTKWSHVGDESPWSGWS